jgi:nitrogen fixation NifU-like protein
MVSKMNDLQDLYQQVIIDHNHNPCNFKEIEHASHSAKGHNPLCGDKINIYLIVKDREIVDIGFNGSGCAISKASSSLMTEALIGKTIDEADNLFDKVHDMLTNGKSAVEEIGKLAVLSGVYKFPARVKCAILPWHTLKNALDKKNQIAVTE